MSALDYDIDKCTIKTLWKREEGEAGRNIYAQHNYNCNGSGSYICEFSLMMVFAERRQQQRGKLLRCKEKEGRMLRKRGPCIWHFPVQPAWKNVASRVNWRCPAVLPTLCCYYVLILYPTLLICEWDTFLLFDTLVPVTPASLNLSFIMTQGKNTRVEIYLPDKLKTKLATDWKLVSTKQAVSHLLTWWVNREKFFFYSSSFSCVILVAVGVSATVSHCEDDRRQLHALSYKVAILFVLPFFCLRP